MILNGRGKIVDSEWERSEAMRDEVLLDAFVVVPNHLRGTRRKDSKEAEDAPNGPSAQSLSAMVGGFKAAATTCINEHRGTPGASVWQSRYHDRILRNEREWRAQRKYIERNPGWWSRDRYHPVQ